MATRFWTQVRVLWVCAIWLGAAVLLCWGHGWSAPEVTSVTGAIVYWLAYSGAITVVLAAVFYVGRGIVRGARKLLSR